jgi:pyruvate,water dikinase
MAHVLDFGDVRMKMLAEVGGKTASLGEMAAHLGSEGIAVPDGFAVKSSAYLQFLKHNDFGSSLCAILRALDCRDLSNLEQVGAAARALIARGTWPETVRDEIAEAYLRLMQRCPEGTTLAVRSSGVADENLAGSSFAGQMASYLNVSSLEGLLKACRDCFASLYSDRAIRYRTENSFSHLSVGVSVCVQRMVRSDLACSGIAFTSESGAINAPVTLIYSVYGLGKGAQGRGASDQFEVSRDPGGKGDLAIRARRLGPKEKTRVCAPGGEAGDITQDIETPPEKRGVFSLPDEDVLKVADMCRRIEEYYGQLMDVVWAKDGLTGELFVVQARPHYQRPSPAQANESVQGVASGAGVT